MPFNQYYFKCRPRFLLGIWTLVMVVMVLSACSGPVLSTAVPISVTPAASFTAPPLPLTVTHTPPTPTATITASPTSQPTSTPTALPLAAFQTQLPAAVVAQSYLSDACQLLNLRWDPQNSLPGTIVVPVMFHSIAKTGRPITDDSTISEEYYFRFIERAHQLGFKTITSAQLVDFLQKNAKIPAQSLLMIVDDRKRAEYFTKYFFPYLEKYSWTVTNAWISHPDTPAYLWKENEGLIPSGLVDFQAHGVIHNTPIEEGLPEDFVRNEIFGPLQPMEQHFGKRPIAFIWPRGLFTPHAVNLAREAGYQIGFTAYPRGPLLFNWIPLGVDEQKANDPVMVLPRYWDTTAISALDEALQIQQAAQSFFTRQRLVELSYYRQYCSNYPKLPEP